MEQPKYRISPSLLNAYDEYVNAEKLFEKYFGASENPSVSLAEFEKRQETELLDALNRVDRGPIEAASRGTALNEIVDCIIERRQPQDDISLKSVRDPYGKPSHIIAELDGFTFLFDMSMCMELAAYFRGSICQYRCEATIDTRYGPVILYGDADYIRKDIVYDLKSTGKYDYGKYSDGYQKDLYPWCLIESGEIDRISEFEYSVAVLHGGGVKDPIITWDFFRERYDYDHARSEGRLRGAAEGLIQFIELHRSEIHHKRVFNQ